MTRPTTLPTAVTVVAGLVAAAAVIIAGFQLGQRHAAGPGPAIDTPAPAAATAAAAPSPTPSGADAVPGEGAAGEHPSLTGSEAPGDEVGGPTPYSLSLHARARWEPVVIGFGHTFATNHRPLDTSTWLASLRPLVTTALAGELAATDPARIPVGTYTGWHLVDAADTQLTVQINYDNGDAVLVDLVTDGEHWAISRIQPA